MKIRIEVDAQGKELVYSRQVGPALAEDAADALADELVSMAALVRAFFAVKPRIDQ